MQNAFKWQPLMHSTEIGVTAYNGSVTFTGSVDSYTKKIETENATKNLAELKAIVQKIEVHHHDSWCKKKR